MKPYRIKHVPTGLYYQPHKHRGSNWSKKGKIYQTKNNPLAHLILSDDSNKKNSKNNFRVYVDGSTQIYKQYKDKLTWLTTHTRDEFAVDTLISDWIIEEI